MGAVQQYIKVSTCALECRISWTLGWLVLELEVANKLMNFMKMFLCHLPSMVHILILDEQKSSKKCLLLRDTFLNTAILVRIGSLF